MIRRKKTKKQASAPQKPWADRYLEERGIDRAFAEQNGVKVEGDRIVFLKFHPLTGERIEGSRTRLREPITIKGKLAKFIQRKGSDSFPYFASCIDWKAAFADRSTPLVISEGETRALAGTKQHVFVIGCGGVDGVFMSGTRRQKLHSIFSEMKLKGRVIYLSFDVDAESNSNVRDAENAAAKLFADARADVRVVRLPRVTADGKTGLDDLFAKPHGRDWFGELCDAAPKWRAALSNGPEPIVRSLHGIESKLPDYIWNKRIARGETTMMSGDPGSAKTFAMNAVAAELSRGRVPVTGERCKPLRILYCTTENSPEHVIAPRFRAMGGDDRNLFLLESAWTLADVSPLEHAIVKYKIDLVVLDPLQSYFGEGADSHKATEVRPRMDALMRIAARHNIAIVIIRHLAKAASGRAIHRGMGSIDFSAAVRIELMVGHRADTPNDRAIITVKNNLGEYAPALGFSVEGNGLKARVRWTGETDMKLADLTAPEATSKGPKTKIAQCEGYLRALLLRGPVKVADIMAHGAFDARTVQRAAENLGVRRSGSKSKREVTLTLPKFAQRYTTNGAGSAKSGREAVN